MGCRKNKSRKKKAEKKGQRNPTNNHNCKDEAKKQIEEGKRIPAD